MSTYRTRNLRKGIIAAVLTGTVAAIIGIGTTAPTWAADGDHISNEVLEKNTIPGTKENKQPGGGQQANPETRGCSSITRCKH